LGALAVSAFDYHLPAALIADRPARPREAARLLHVADGLSDRVVADLPGLLRPGDLLVFNDTRVIPARLEGRRGRVAVSMTLHRALASDTWLALARPAKRLRVGQRVDIAPGFAAEVTEKRETGEIALRFPVGGAALLAALDRHGRIPLPPYMGREADADDAVDYQTALARRPGAVAAPTAGLHFTPALLDRIAGAGIAHATVTLHVGAGTFLPVRVERVDDHRMLSEWGEIPDATAARIAATRASGGRVVAVGTTAVRLLETAARDDGTVAPFTGETGLFIRPGHRFRAVDRMVTNFHLPRSTLLMLVSAFAGMDRIRAAYAHAVARGYRFYSYGDCCLLEPERR